MQITYLNYFLASIVAYLGLLLGVILRKIAPEEQKPGKKYFIFLKKAIFLLVLVFYLFFYNFNSTLSLILLAFTLILMLNKKLKLEKTGLTYFFFGLVFYLSSRILNLFIIETVLIFLYGIPTSSLILKKKNYSEMRKNAKHFLHTKNSRSEFFSVFIKNLWFFVPVLLYLVF